MGSIPITQITVPSDESLGHVGGLAFSASQREVHPIEGRLHGRLALAWRPKRMRRSWINLIVRWPLRESECTGRFRKAAESPTGGVKQNWRLQLLRSRAEAW